MKAAILTEIGSQLLLSDIQIPSLEFGQVLVKIFYSSICGSQLGEIDGVKGFDHFLPHLLGHEGSAVVQETGAGVKKVTRGDHVVLHWRQGDGIQCTPPKYTMEDGTIVNAGWITTFNEYAIVSENRVTPIPKSFDLKTAPLLGCAITTGFGVINNDAQVKIGQSVAVLGSGGVGLNEIQAASLVSAYPIIAIDIFDHKLELAKKLGATHTINTKKQDIQKEILSLVGKNGIDVFVDNTGKPEMIQTAYNLTSPTGKTILVGVPKKGDNISIYSLPLHFGKILKGSHGGGVNPSEDIPRIIRLVDANKLDLQNQISAIYNFSEINEAIQDMRDGKIAGRCIIKFDIQ